jgi:hypothetical protein
VLQILIPLAIPWVLIAFLSQENSIITWYVFLFFQESATQADFLGPSSAASCTPPSGPHSSARAPPKPPTSPGASS